MQVSCFIKVGYYFCNKYHITISNHHSTNYSKKSTLSLSLSLSTDGEFHALTLLYSAFLYFSNLIHTEQTSFNYYYV